MHRRVFHFPKNFAIQFLYYVCKIDVITYPFSFAYFLTSFLGPFSAMNAQHEILKIYSYFNWMLLLLNILFCVYVHIYWHFSIYKMKQFNIHAIRNYIKKLQKALFVVYIVMIILAPIQFYSQANMMQTYFWNQLLCCWVYFKRLLRVFFSLCVFLYVCVSFE